MAPSASDCPMLMAAFVAVLGIGLIIGSSFWPMESVEGDSFPRVPQEHLYERYLRALQGISSPGPLTVVDFGDGLGLGVNRRVPAGSVLFSVPESLALEPGHPKTCNEVLEDTCAAEKAVVTAVSQGEVSRLVGLIALLVLARRRGLAEDVAGGSAAAAALAALPDLSAKADFDLFAIDEDEFRVFATGTSMEGWQPFALNETAKAHDFVRNRINMVGADAVNISLAEIRWAFLSLHAHAQWVQDVPEDQGVGIPPQAVFLLPLFLARPTPDWRYGVEIRHDPANRIYDIISPRALRPGDEIHYVDRRLTDASAFCFRGLQLVNQHRARLILDLSGAPRDPAAQPILDKYACGGQPLQLYVQSQKAVDPNFLGCMRMLALAANTSRLERAVRNGWTSKWPQTGPVDRSSEAAATELAVSVLQQALTRIGGSNTEIKHRFGRDSVAVRPAVRVREAETMIIVGLLKAMKDLQLISSSEYLFEALRDEQMDALPRVSG